MSELADLLAEKERRAKQRAGIPVEEGMKSVLVEGTGIEKGAFDTFNKMLESVGKGAARGSLELVTLWPAVWDAIKKNDSPNALTATGISEAIRDATGVDIMSIPEGTTTPFEFGRAAAPATLMSAAGVPGLFGRSAKGLAGEAAITGSAGAAAKEFAPDSPLAQFLLQSTPYALKGGYKKVQQSLTKPEGTISKEAASLQEVGPMTPGEASQSRAQLATEALVAGDVGSGVKPSAFRVQQAQATENFLNRVIDPLISKAEKDPIKLATQVNNAVRGYGKNLATTLKTQANRDFGLAEKMPGLVDTSPIINKLTQLKDDISKYAPHDTAQIGAIDKIIKDIVNKGKPEVRTPGLIVSERGVPLSEQVTPATPDTLNKITIKDLKRAISDWSDTVYSGKKTIGGSDIFQNVAPGQSSQIARTILRGYKDSLDAAIDGGIPGAAQLKKARDNFAENINEIDKFAKSPINRRFGKPINELVPEEVVAKLEKLQPSQQALLFNMVKNESPALSDSVRRLKIKKIMDKAKIEGAKAGEPTFNINEALKALQKNKDQFNFLFPTKQSRADVNKAIAYMQRVWQRGEQAPSRLGNVPYEIARAGGAGPQGAFITQLLSGMKGVFATPKALADVIFDPESVNRLLALSKKGSTEKVVDFLEAATSAIGRQTARTGVLYEQDRPQQQTTQQPFNELQQLLEERARRQTQ